MASSRKRSISLRLHESFGVAGTGYSVRGWMAHQARSAGEKSADFGRWGVAV